VVVIAQGVRGMTATTRRFADEQDIAERAAGAGFRLVQYETSDGQLVWEWLRGEEPRPQFVSRRVALNYMEDRLRRDEQTRHHLKLRRRAHRRPS
jgi:hypothetical protein